MNASQHIPDGSAADALPPHGDSTRSSVGEAKPFCSLRDLIRTQYRATGFTFLPKQPIHSLLSGRKASRLRGRGLNFEELRRYLPGDDVRNMDWKVTARTRKPHVRVYTEERDRPVLIIVDQRTSMFFGSQTRFKSVTAAEAAASAAWRTIDAGDRVGGIVFGDHHREEIRPRRSRERVLQFLQAVVRANNQLTAGQATNESADPLDAALRRARQLANHDHLIIVISDFSGAGSETRELLTGLSQHNDVLAMFVFDPLEQTFPEAGALVVSDGDKQLEWNSSSAASRKEFRRRFDERLERASHRLQKSEVPVIALSTAHDVIRQIQKRLGQRPGHQARS